MTSQQGSSSSSSDISERVFAIIIDKLLESDEYVRNILSFMTVFPESERIAAMLYKEKKLIKDARSDVVEILARTLDIVKDVCDQCEPKQLNWFCNAAMEVIGLPRRSQCLNTDWIRKIPGRQYPDYDKRKLFNFIIWMEDPQIDDPVKWLLKHEGKVAADSFATELFLGTSEFSCVRNLCDDWFFWSAVFNSDLAFLRGYLGKWPRDSPYALYYAILSGNQDMFRKVAKCTRLPVYTETTASMDRQARECTRILMMSALRGPANWKVVEMAMSLFHDILPADCYWQIVPRLYHSLDAPPDADSSDIIGRTLVFHMQAYKLWALRKEKINALIMCLAEPNNRDYGMDRCWSCHEIAKFNDLVKVMEATPIPTAGETSLTKSLNPRYWRLPPAYKDQDLINDYMKDLPDLREDLYSAMIVLRYFDETNVRAYIKCIIACRRKGSVSESELSEITAKAIQIGVEMCRRVNSETTKFILG